MSKLKKHSFVDIDIRLQVERFSITLQELVQHRNNEVCNNTVSFLVFDGMFVFQFVRMWYNLNLSISSKNCFEPGENGLTNYIYNVLALM